MFVPSSYSRLVREQIEIGPASDHSLIYPPIGFHSWPIGGVGNGDEFGYYWPVGKENSDPIVAMTSHDCWALIPVASSIEALARLKDCLEITAIANGYAEVDDDSDEPIVALEDRLTLDPNSPYLLVACADFAQANNKLEESESYYLRAIELLPEYTAAQYGLVMLYRRQRNIAEAYRWMGEAIRSPLCFQGISFWADTSLPDLNRNDFRRKCLMWLQQARTDSVQMVADDPLFKLRDQLTFATGVKTTNDFTLYEQAIEEYANCGKILDAIRLLMLYGEVMKSETISFQERSGFTLPKFREWYLRLCRQGSVDRAVFLEPHQ